MTTEAGNGTSDPTNNGNKGHKSAEVLVREQTATNLAARLFQSILTTKESTHDNVVISPLLLEAALALLYLGSDGSTAEQLKNLLQLNTKYVSNAKMANYYATQLAVATGQRNRSSDICDSVAVPNSNVNAASTHIKLCSRIVLPSNYEISDEFRKISAKYFQTEARAGPTEHGGIEYSVPADSMTAAILFVAADFQNKWFLPFSAYRTGSYDFYMVDKQSTSQQIARPVAMLFDDDMFVKFGEFRELDARAIELPYEWENEDNDNSSNVDDVDELSMLLVLPNQRDGLARLETQLCETDLTALTERMQMESVQVLLPKFRINCEVDLRQCLEKLGISTIFSKDANFKNLLHENCPKPFQFERIIQKCCIEVNESGSDAAKVIGGGALKPIVISNSLNGRQKFFRADHPFFFAVRSSNAVYFMGQVASL